MDKRAYFVVGPESSGTRLWTRILIRAGCWGQDGHGQKMDGLSFEGRPDTIVFRRSVPHAKRWPAIVEIIQRMRAAGYKVTVVQTDRDPRYMVASQVRVGHVATEEQARDQIAEAHRHIQRAIQETRPEYLLVSYDVLVMRPRWMLRRTLERLGLPMVEIDIYDGNAKYREGAS